MDNQEELFKTLIANSEKTLVTLDVMMEAFVQLYSKVDDKAISYETALVNLKNEITLRLESSKK